MSKRKTQEEFEKEVYDLVGDEYKVLGEYKSTHTKIKMLHTKCGNEFDMSPSDFLRGNRCPFCSPFPKKIDINVNSMWSTNPELAKLLLNPEDGYRHTQYSNKKVDWRCLECCQIIRNKMISRVNIYGLSCPNCGDGISYPNRLMFSVLSCFKIDFIPEKYFKWCNYTIDNQKMTGRYDFYFKHDSQEYVVEMDGHFHFNDNLMNGQTKEYSQEIDIIKDNLAREHNIHPIRIDCQEPKLDYIKQEIMKSDLINIFDLSTVDWQECQKQSITSLKLQACDLWKEQRSIKIVSEIMKKSDTTIRRWLKFCTEIGLCDYDPVIELKNRVIKISSKVFCINTDEIFNSMINAGQKYNVKASSISKCCQGKRKSAGKLPDGTRLKWQYVN